MARRAATTDLETFFEYGVDLTTRTYYLGSKSSEESEESGVNYRMAEDCIKALHFLDSRAPGGDSPITIIANVPGGDVEHGMAIFGAIKACKNFVTVKMLGQAYSMGSVIPQAADERVIDPYCKFMIHYGEASTSGHSKEVVRNSDFLKRLDWEIENIYLESMLKKDQKEYEAGNKRHLEKALASVVNRLQSADYPPAAPVKYKFSRVPKKRKEEVRVVLRKLLNFSCYLEPEEVVALGFADRVGT